MAQSQRSRSHKGWKAGIWVITRHHFVANLGLYHIARTSGLCGPCVTHQVASTCAFWCTQWPWQKKKNHTRECRPKIWLWRSVFIAGERMLQGILLCWWRYALSECLLFFHLSQGPTYPQLFSQYSFSPSVRAKSIQYIHMCVCIQKNPQICQWLQEKYMRVTQLSSNNKKMTYFRLYKVYRLWNANVSSFLGSSGIKKPPNDLLINS